MPAIGATLDRRLGGLPVTAPGTKAGLDLKWAIAACRAKLFVFVARRDVPATNNVSEQALRSSGDPCQPRRGAGL